MHQIRFWAELCPDPADGRAYIASPDILAKFKKPIKQTEGLHSQILTKMFNYAKTRLVLLRLTSNLSKAHVTRDGIGATTWGINAQRAMK